MKNINTMKKAELIELINSQKKVIEGLTAENKELKNALAELKDGIKSFATTVNTIYKNDTVRVATSTITSDNITASDNKAAVKTMNKGKKEAPEKPDEANESGATKNEEPAEEIDNNDDMKPDNKAAKTYKEGLDEYKIKKYGSIEIADRVQAMTKVIAEEWREKARKTGKLPVARNEYKTKLYDTAFERVKEEMKKEEEAKKAASKKTNKTRSTRRTK